MDNQYNPASDDFGDINVAWNCAFDAGCRSGARFMARAASRLRPKPVAPPDKLNGRAHHTANGNSNEQKLPFDQDEEDEMFKTDITDSIRADLRQEVQRRGVRFYRLERGTLTMRHPETLDTRFFRNEEEPLDALRGNSERLLPL